MVYLLMFAAACDCFRPIAKLDLTPSPFLTLSAQMLLKCYQPLQPVIIIDRENPFIQSANHMYSAPSP
jgi:hypothetical protein